MMIEDRCNSSSSNGVNGFLNGSSSTSGSGGGSGSSELQTYKRRKYGILGSSCKLVELEKHSYKPSTRLDEKMVKELVNIGLQKNSCEQVCDQKINCHSLLNGSDDCSYQHWKFVMENMSQSLSPSKDGVGSIQHCIRDALNHPCTNNANMTKESSEHQDGQSHLHRTCMLNGSSSAAKGLSAVASNGSSSESGHPTVSRMCEHVFLRVIMSEKFAVLCKLLSENFHGLKVEKLLDFSLINSRIKEGAYEHSPMLFSSDIQQIWRMLHSTGSQMVSLANNLSELSRAFCHELGGAAEDTSSDRKHELPAWDSDMRSKWEEPSASVFCTCRECGEKSDGKDCLVCDSCEEMFHVSCIQPAVKEIPHKNWYCAICTSSGIVSPHKDCAVCERLNANFGMNGGADTVPTYEEALDEFEESSDGIIETGLQVFKGSKQLPCKVCGCILINGEEYRVCEHRFCQYKYYHTRCLTSKQLKSYGPRWYCPSCLCRVCLTDKDDDDLVMCDGCDHGYHIYCMNPPRTSIPKGKWFCTKCDAGIQAIREAKKLYEGLERKQKKSEGKRVIDGSPKKSMSDIEEVVGGSGGMDMLLTAAKTLNEEESATLDGKI